MKKLAARPWFAPLVVSIVVVLLAAGAWLLVNGTYIPVLDPSGEVAGHQRNIIVFTIILSLVVILPVFTMLAIFAWNYRAGKKTKRYTPDWDENNTLEAVWWGIPVVIIIGLSILTYVTSHSLDPYRAIESDQPTLEVEVVALQWKWLFIYPDQQIATVNDLTIPVNRPVHFRLSADAPMSAFWIPALGSQIYSMNAMSSQLNLIANETGKFTGYNTNINGEGYAKMQFDVNSVNQADFEKWQQRHRQSTNSLTQESYQQLAKPGVPDGPLYYALGDENIYDSIIMKYMSHEGVDYGQHSPGHGAPEPLDEAFDPDKRQDDMSADVDQQQHHEGMSH